MAVRIVLPVPPDPRKANDTDQWQKDMFDWGNDVKGKLETYSRIVLVAIDSTPIGANAPSTGAFTNLTATGTITGLKLSGAFNGTVGATTPSTGAFTTVSASGSINGQTLVISDPNANTQSIIFQNLQANGVNIRLTGNGGTTPNKYIRVLNGQFQIVNSANSAAPLTLTDAGALTITGGLSATTGAFSGAVSGTTGTFTGAVSGTTGTYSGAVGMVGATFGSTVAPGGSTDLSKHIALYTSGGSYGFSITAARLNTVVPATAAHVVVVNGVDVSSTASTGLTVNSPSGTSGIIINGASNASGGNLCLTGNGATTPSKFLRCVNGQFDIVNNAYTSAIFSVLDNGMVETPYGYQSRQGIGGATTGNAHNLYYAGAGAVQLWIDSTNIGTITVTSDERYKHFIESLPDTGLDRINQLRPVSFRYNNKGIFNDDGKTRESFIAQEVEKVIPSAVENVSEDQPKTLNLLAILAVAVKSIQELTARVAVLEASKKE